MIPIAKPQVDGAEIEAVTRVLWSGRLVQGEMVKAFEDAFARYCGVEYAVAVSNGTVALDLVLKALGITGGEVIVPDFTFIATANAVLMQSALPVFADIEPDTYNINPDHVDELISSRTAAIIGVHLFGQPCNVSALTDIAEDCSLPFIEDCAQAHGASYNGVMVGGCGDAGIFSFYGTKNMTTGEGGMVTTRIPKLADRIKSLRDHGSTQKYVHTELGYNYRMTDIQAAIGLAQLTKLETFNARRIANAEYFNREIRNPNITKPLFYCNDIRHVYHQYAITTESAIARSNLQEHLTKNGVGWAVHYPFPVHRQPLYQKLGYSDAKVNCPVSIQTSERILSLPVHPALTPEECEHIVNTINSWRCE